MSVIWWLSDSRLLPPSIKELIADPDHTLFVSMASAWEIAIKKNLGKLEAPDDLKAVLEENHIETLPITFSHIEKLVRLPTHHRDPFDRMLIAQAIVENLTLVTHDVNFRSYDCPLLLF